MAKASGPTALGMGGIFPAAKKTLMGNRKMSQLEMTVVKWAGFSLFAKNRYPILGQE